MSIIQFKKQRVPILLHVLILVQAMRTFGGVRSLLIVLGAKFYEGIRRFDTAAQFWEKGLRITDNYGKNGIFKTRQFWEFFLEKAYADSGNSRVEDPLFDCSIRKNQIKNKGRSGYYAMDFTHLGLRITGYVTSRRINTVDIYIDSLKLRSIPVLHTYLMPGYFHFHIKREVLSDFPAVCTVKVLTMESEALLFEGGNTAEMHVPHGSGCLQNKVENGYTVDKKGFYFQAQSEIVERQNMYLMIYNSVNTAFQKMFSTPLFLLYGTLLGYIREGDFIAGDDDFDAGWFSLKTNPEEVKKETMTIVIEMVLAGFVCSFNRSGRLFRIRRPQDPPGVHLDIRPVWFQNSRIWLHKQACLCMHPDQFLPVKVGRLRNTEVSLPNDAEAFLAEYYGQGWSVPDPGYSNASKKVPADVLKTLNKITIDTDDYEWMREQIDLRRKQFPDAGKLISPGTHPLYPLDEYEANCEW